jgi:hypothetical protein
MRVINLRKTTLGDAVYVGRANATMMLPQSPFANPYHMRTELDRPCVLDLYRKYLRHNPSLVDRMRRELAGIEAIACWCAPKACHADLIAEVVAGAEP